jgi:hypothetical protein
VLTVRGAIFCAGHAQEKTNNRRSGMNAQTATNAAEIRRPAFDLQPLLSCFLGWVAPRANDPSRRSVPENFRKDCDPLSKTTSFRTSWG